MTVIGERGEFTLIAQLAELFRASPQGSIVSIGDDCAVVEGREGFFYLLTCDTQVEGSHFLLDLIPPRYLGRRVLAVNLSDIAAMGGKPRWVLLSFVLRKDIENTWWEELLQGIHEEAQAYGLEVIGGNLASTASAMVFDVTLLGEVERGRPLLLRSCAQVGDVILVTGFLGEAKAGLTIAREGSAEERERYFSLVERFFAPQPRVEVGQFLGDLKERIALIDVSDGLVQDLAHIGERSGVGAVIEVDALPVSPSLAEWCRERDIDPLPLVLEGGEDFELLFTLREDLAEYVIREVPARFGIPLHCIGRIVAEEGIRLKRGDTLEVVVPRGWDHFQRG